jgi:hypothetical protein
MDDRRAQFLIAVGDLCTAAGLAGLEVEVRPNVDRSERIRGVPYPHRAADAGADTINETGYARPMAIGDHVIDLDDIHECTVYAPQGT